ncbi:hypothetical protein BGZ52_008070 [Haplosporangium bisporale]|nr:hypothetical protein BGZ52_008070 [Haplosporangium bisporale]
MDGQTSVREGKRRATTPPSEPSHKKPKSGAFLDDLIQQVLESLNDRQHDLEKAFRSLLKASSVSAQALAHAPELEANAVASELEKAKVRLNKGIKGLKRSKLMLEETCMALKVKEEPQDDDIGLRPRRSESVVAVSKEPVRDWVHQEFDELEGRLQGVIMCLREAREAQQPLVTATTMAIITNPTTTTTTTTTPATETTNMETSASAALVDPQIHELDNLRALRDVQKHGDRLERKLQVAQRELEEARSEQQELQAQLGAAQEKVSFEGRCLAYSVNLALNAFTTANIRLDEVEHGMRGKTLSAVKLETVKLLLTGARNELKETLTILSNVQDDLKQL